MSPEQISKEGLVDSRSDIFSFGSLLFEMCCGFLPFQGDHDWSVLYAIINSQPEPFDSDAISLPPGIETIIQKCLHKNPAARWQSTAEIQTALAGLSNSKKTVPSTPNTEKRYRHFWPVIALFTMTLLLTGGWFLRHNFYSAKFCSEKAIDALLENDVEDANLWLERAIKKDPKYATAWTNLAALHFEQAHWEQAVETAEQALALQSNNIEACFILGRSLEQLNQPWTALKYYKQAVAIDSLRIQAYNDAALVFLNQNQPDSALVMLFQCLSRQPDSELHAYTHKNIGLAYDAMGQRKHAKTQFEISLQIDSTLTVSRDYLHELQEQEKF
jgi:tetratricopeptide (TPR) repeat protein